QFQEFEATLLRMAQNLEKSSRREDRERAAVLKEAIRTASQLGTDQKFDALIELLRSNDKVDLNEIKEAMQQSKIVADDIRVLLAILLSDSADARRKEEINRLKGLIKALEKSIRE